MCGITFPLHLYKEEAAAKAKAAAEAAAKEDSNT